MDVRYNERVKEHIRWNTSLSATASVQLHDSAPAARWVPGRRIAASESEARLAKWVDGLTR